MYSGSPDDDLPTPAYLSGTRSYAVLHSGRFFNFIPISTNRSYLSSLVDAPSIIDENTKKKKKKRIKCDVLELGESVHRYRSLMSGIPTSWLSSSLEKLQNQTHK